MAERSKAFKAPVSSEARVRIPPLPVFFFIMDTISPVLDM